MAYSTINKPGAYFKSVTFTGNGSSQSVSSLDFQPDLVWIKNRGQARDHVIADSVRGATGALKSNSAAAEATDATKVASIDINGFSLGSDNSTNESSESLVAWNWLAAGSTTTSNNDGTIASEISANTTAGFSIVKYVGDGNDNATVGTGLTNLAAVLVKDRDIGTNNWVLKHKNLASDDCVVVNRQDAKGDARNAVAGSFSIDGRFRKSDRGYYVARQGATGTNNAYVDIYDHNGNLQETLTTTNSRAASRLRVTGTGNWIILTGSESGYTQIDAWYLSNTSRTQQHLKNKSYSSGQTVLRESTSDGNWYEWTSTTTTTETPDDGASNWTKGAQQTVAYQHITGTQSYSQGFLHHPSVMEVGERSSDGALVGSLYTNTQISDGSQRDKTFSISRTETTGASLYNGSAGPSSHRGSAWAIGTRTGAIAWANSRDPISNSQLSIGTIASVGFFGVSNTQAATAIQKESTGHHINFVWQGNGNGGSSYEGVWYQYNDHDGTSGNTQIDGSARRDFNPSSPTNEHLSHMGGGESYMFYANKSSGDPTWTIKKANTAGNFGSLTTLSDRSIDLNTMSIEPNAFNYTNPSGQGRSSNELWITDEDRSTDAFTINELSNDYNFIRRFRCTSTGTTALSAIPIPDVTPALAGGGIGTLNSSTFPVALGTGGTGLFQTNSNGSNYIAYCFSEVRGFSKFGKYTGNGNADGAFVNLGFKPAMLIIKNASTGSTDWLVFDETREGYNPDNDALTFNGSAAETTTDYVNMLGNGFKVISTDGAVNTDGDEYIYMAFASSTLVGTNNVVSTAR